MTDKEWTSLKVGDLILDAYHRICEILEVMESLDMKGTAYWVIERVKPVAFTVDSSKDKGISDRIYDEAKKGQTFKATVSERTYKILDVKRKKVKGSPVTILTLEQTDPPKPFMAIEPKAWRLFNG